MFKRIRRLSLLAVALTSIACQLFSVAPSPTPGPSPTPARQNADQVDEQSGYQVHVMYVLPSDGVDRNLDTNGTLANSIGSFQNWLMDQSGGVKLRFDT